MLLPAEQLKYRRIRNLIERELEICHITPMTDIWVYPQYPFGWEAVLGAEPDRVYIFKGRKSKIFDLDVRPIKGIRKNGSLIY